MAVSYIIVEMIYKHRGELTDQLLLLLHRCAS